MKYRIISFLAVSGLFLWASEGQAEANKKAHVHGAAKLILALENTMHGSIELDVPAESIYGFEHKAISKEDKVTQENGFKKLRANPYSLVQLPTDCVVKTQKVGLEAEEEDEKIAKEASEKHGEHADVNASYSVACVKSLHGARVRVPLFDLFPKIKAVSFQVLSSTGQTEVKVKSSHEPITLP